MIDIVLVIIENVSVEQRNSDNSISVEPSVAIFLFWLESAGYSSAFPIRSESKFYLVPDQNLDPVEPHLPAYIRESRPSIRKLHLEGEVWKRVYNDPSSRFFVSLIYH